MRHFHKMILKMLPGPILGWLGMLMFLLVMQFLIKYLPDLVGKGLPLLVVVELVAYNLAYMLVLAVPMSVLIASLMTFGRLTESGAYAVMKSSGVSFVQLAWPVLLVSMVLAGGMTYFNNIVLPEANFRARNLWQDIRLARPGFALRPGVFYDGLDDYKILVRRIPPDRPNDLEDIVIFDYTNGPRNRTDIKAERGRIEAGRTQGQLDLVLFNGEVHRKRPPADGNEERYEKLVFLRHQLRIPLGDLDFERSDVRSGARTDRTMPTEDMARIVDSLEANVRDERQRLEDRFERLGRRTPSELRTFGRVVQSADGVPPSDAPPHPTARIGLAGLDSLTQHTLYLGALNDARTSRTRLAAARESMQFAADKADRYRVEIHKKYSIAVACIIFLLIGGPLGVSLRRGGLGTAAVLALAIFMFYWVALVNGEKFADRGYLEPWVGMWGANIVGGLLGMWLTLRVTLDQRATRAGWRRFFGLKTGASS